MSTYILCICIFADICKSMCHKHGFITLLWVWAVIPLHNMHNICKTVLQGTCVWYWNIAYCIFPCIILGILICPLCKAVSMNILSQWLQQTIFFPCSKTAICKQHTFHYVSEWKGFAWFKRGNKYLNLTFFGGRCKLL